MTDIPSAPYGQGTSPNEAAARWLARLNADSISAAEREAFYDWLNSSPENRQAYEALTDLWDELETFVAAPGVLEERAAYEAGFQKPHFWRLGFANLKRAMGQPGIALAAVVSCLLIVGTVIYYQNLPTRYQTGPGEQQIVSLSDGSTAHLNANTRLSVNFSQATRRIILERGQALFTVAHNKARPFVVDAGLTEVVAVGTVFDVHREKNLVTVSVVEGIVRVKEQQPESAGQAPLEQSLKMAQQVSFDEQGRASNIQPVDLKKLTLWHRDTLTFENIALADAVHEFNQTAAIKIQIADARLGSIRISGRFGSSDSKAFTSALTEWFPVKVETRDDGTLALLYKEPTS